MQVIVKSVRMAVRVLQENIGGLLESSMLNICATWGLMGNSLDCSYLFEES